MVATARARWPTSSLALGVPVFAAERGATRSHQFAVLAQQYGGGQTAAHRLRRANLLACGIGLPAAPVEADVNGLRIGTPELARLGMSPPTCPTWPGSSPAAWTRLDPAVVAPR